MPAVTILPSGLMVNVPPLASYDEQGQYRIPWRIPCLEHIRRYLADKAYSSHPAYVRDLKHIGGYSLGTRLMYVWFDR